MTTMLRYWVPVPVLVLLAAVCAAAAVLERGMAAAQRDLAVANLVAAERGYAAVERRMSRAVGVPWLLSGLQREIGARRAAIRYWRQDYEALLGSDAPRPDDPVFRMTLANAAYRSGQRPDVSPREMLDSLDRSIVLYAALLQDGSGSEDMAYNYEYLVGLRAALEAGAEPMAAPPESPLGREGAQPLDEETGLDDVQIFVSMMQDDRDTVDDPTPGGDPPIRRRG